MYVNDIAEDRLPLEVAGPLLNHGQPTTGLAVWDHNEC
jgi:hypothetical protein